MYQKKDVTRAIMVEWREYYDARIRAHSKRCEIDVYYMDAEEWGAGVDQWRHEGHRDLEFIPNTKVEWAALLQRGADRIARKKKQNPPSTTACEHGSQN
jgi:hypothetical protein